MTTTDDIDDKNQADQPGYGFPVFVTHEGTTFRIQRRECERVGPAAVEATAARRGERPHTRPAACDCSRVGWQTQEVATSGGMAWHGTIMPCLPKQTKTM